MAVELISRPDEDCYNPAYNCVEFCFNSTGFKSVTGTKATFSIELPGGVAGYSAGVVMIIAGETFTTGTSNLYNEIDTAPTQTAAEFAANVKEALESNSNIFDNFSISIVGDAAVATARENGIIENFDFDYTDPLFAGNEPTNSDTQGTEDEYLENYRVVIEIWECSETGVLTNRVSKENRIPDQDGNLCVNVGEKLAPYLETFLAQYQALDDISSWYDDITISKRFCLRYGELYSDDISECSVSKRSFFNAGEFIIYNAAFQLDEFTSKNEDVCNIEWMTSMPDYTKLCETSQAFLWVNVADLLEQKILNPDLRVNSYIDFNYTDGTTESTILANITTVNAANGFYAVAAGIPIISIVANPAKTIDTWRMRIALRDTTLPIPTGDIYYSSQYFQRVKCCENDINLYFLNEFGGYDTLLLQSLNTTELRQEFSVFESFIGCGGDVLANGKGVLGNSAFDVFTATADFSNNYKNRKWLRQAIMAAKKYAQFSIDGEDIFSKIVVFDTSLIYWDKQNNTLRVQIQFMLNQNLNIQKN